MRFLLLAYLICPFVGVSQKIDSLKSAQVNKPTASVYLELASEFLNVNQDSCLYYLEKALPLAKKNEETLADYFENLGSYYYYESKALRALGDSCEKYFSLAEASYRKQGAKEKLAKLVFKMGMQNYGNADMDASLANFQEAQSLYEELDDFFNLAKVMNMHGNVLYRINNYDEALQSFEKASLYGKKGDNESTLYKALGGKALILQEYKLEYDSAILIYDSLYSYFLSKGSIHIAAKAMNNIASCYWFMGDYPKMEVALKETIRLKRQVDDLSSRYVTYELFAKMCYKTGQYNLAEVYADSSGMLAFQFEDPIAQASVWKIKTKILTAAKKYKEASLLYEKYVALKDSINERQFVEDVNELDKKYQTARKDKEIAELSLANETSERKLLEFRIKWYGSSLVAVLIITFLILYLGQYRQKSKLRLALLNEEIDGLRFRIGKIMSDIKLEEVKIDTDKLQNDLPNTLTEREVQILQVAITNKTNSEIADEVHLSVNTVKYHLKNIYNKLGVSTRLEAREALSQIN